MELLKENRKWSIYFAVALRPPFLATSISESDKKKEILLRLEVYMVFPEAYLVIVYVLGVNPWDLFEFDK